MAFLSLSGMRCFNKKRQILDWQFQQLVPFWEFTRNDMIKMTKRRYLKIWMRCLTSKS